MGGKLQAITTGSSTLPGVLVNFLLGEYRIGFQAGCYLFILLPRVFSKTW